MWRQLMVNKALHARAKRAMLIALLRANALSLSLFAALVAATSFFAATTGDWSFPLVGLFLLITMPLLLVRSAGRLATRTPLGTFVAYAVTRDGTLHYSSAGGTVTVNPGFVDRVAATADCWLIALASGLLLIVPRELIPDADAALLVRHRPGRLTAPAASRPPL